MGLGGYLGGTPGANTITSGDVAAGAVVGDDIASGSITSYEIGSGQVFGHLVGHGANIASGNLTTDDLAPRAVLSGNIGSGQIDRLHHNSGCVIDWLACEQALSGLRAVAWGSGGCFVVAAERTSGLRLPAIGVTVGQYVSGDVVSVVRRGLVRISFSGGIASGFPGRPLYVGSGGLVINQSGFMEGASSGHGAAPTLVGSGLSGILVQQIGVAISGGLDVQVGEARSGLISGLLGQY